MKQTLRLFTVAIIMVAFTLSVNAQGSATTAGNAAARIIAPITLTAGNTLNFGTAYNTGGTVIIGTDGSRTGTCAVSAAAPLHSAGTFTVAGSAALTYTTTVPGAPVVITNGTDNMNITAFGHNATGTIVAGGETFSVGATLTVPAGTSSGSYTGTYNVTVAYN